MTDSIKKRKEIITEMEDLPYGDGVMVLPNAALVREIQKHHMVECMTLDTLAEKIFAMIEEYKDYRLISSKTQEFIIKHLLGTYGDVLKYFLPLKDKQGFAKELLGLFTELRRCGVRDAVELQQSLEAWGDNDAKDNDIKGNNVKEKHVNVPSNKNADVCQFFSLYVEYLKKHNLYDLEGRYMLVLEALRENRVELPYKKIRMSDFDILNPLEEEFAHKLGLCNTGEYDVPGEVKLDLPQWQKTEFRYYASHRDEIVGIYQEIKDKVQRGAQYGEFLIVVNRLQDFPGARHLADKMGIPVTAPRTDKVSQHPIMKLMHEKLGTGSKVEEFVANLQKFLGDDNTRKEFGAKYAKQEIDLLELKNYLAVTSKLQQILQGLRETAKACDFMNENLTAEKFWEYLEDATENESYTIMQGDENGVMLTTFVSAVGFPHKYLYVAGLNEEEFPQKFRENWIYSDAERKCFRFSMGIGLPVAMAHYQEALYMFSRMLIMGQEEVVFSYAKADSMDKSTYVDMLKRQLCKDGQEITEQDLRAGNYHRVINIVEDATMLQELAKVDELRQDEASVFNGNLTMDFGDKPIEMNCSKLKTFADCPFKYLVQEIWHLDLSYDSDAAIDSLDQGNFVHKVIARYFEEVQPNEVPDEKEALLKICAEEVQALLSDEKKKYKDYVGNDKKLFDSEIKELTEKILEWYGKDKSERKVTMRSFANEKAFGKNEEGGIELFTGLDHRVLFNGRIDHIDEITMEDKSKRYYVTDYKIGTVPGGECNVQVPIYIRALALEHPDCLIGGSYFGFKNMKRGGYYPDRYTPLKGMIDKEDDKRTKKSEPTYREIFKERENNATFYDNVRTKLNELIGGKFSPKSGNCDYCPLNSICRKVEVK